MDEYTGPKVINTAVGRQRFTQFESTIPDPAYVAWLEQKVAELNRQFKLLSQSNASLRQQIFSMQVAESRRWRWDQDHVPYGDDEYR
jgi:hypothetical protein